MANFTTAQRKELSVRGIALPDGSFPIRNAKDLSNAIASIGRAKSEPRARAHITRRARALGLASMLPKEWGINSEAVPVASMVPLQLEADISSPVLALEGSYQAIILEEPSAENGGRMRIRVPFTVGDSVARAKGFDIPLFFPKEDVPFIIQEATKQIEAGLQPLTVYARHSQRNSKDHLPIGAVTGVHQEGRVGLADIELEPVIPDGVNAQMLIKGKKLNAVSLVTDPGHYVAERKKVNGELMLEITKQAISGVDFAPDGPAQPTYGIQILQEVVVEAAEASPPIPSPKTPRRSKPHMDEPITLEMVRDYPEVISAVESPLRAEIAKITLERDGITVERDQLLAEKREGEKAAQIDAMVARFPEASREEAKRLLLDHCKDAHSREEVIIQSAPFLLAQIDEMGKVGVQAEKPKTTEEQLAALFVKPAGAGNPATPETPAAKQITQEQIDAYGTVGGLMLPED